MPSMATFVILEKIRETISFLRKSSVSSELVSDGKSIVAVLKELQTVVRYGDLAAIDPRTILFPFLRILRSQSIAGPLVRNSIDAIQAILISGALSTNSTYICDALGDIVDTTTRCRFVHTDTAGDELVHLHIIETLRIVMISSPASSLSDASQWKILQFCLVAALKSGGPSGSMIVYQAAERTVHECISTLLRQSREDDEDANSHLAAAAHAEGKDSSCLCRLLSYIAKIIADTAAERNSINSFAVNSTGGSAPLSSQSHRRSLSQQQHLPPEPPMNELSHDRATLHLLFAMKTLSYMLTAAGHADGVRMVLVRSKEFARILTDELGYSLLQLCSASVGTGSSSSKAGSGGSQSPQHFNATYNSTTVLSAVLSTFGALLRAAGLRLRILLDCFVRQVYLKALMHTQSLFIEQLQYINEGIELVAPLLSIHSSVEAASSSADFRLDELEVIFESLSDLLSDVSVLPTWFASFDCDPTSADLVQPLVQYLCRCNCLALSYSTELTTGYFRSVGLLVTQMFKQVMKTLVLRNEQREQLTAGPRTNSIAQKNNSSSSSNSQDLLDAQQRQQALSSLLKASRGAKHILAEAARLFVEKPEKGLRYLQQIGGLPTPLTPESVAAFLRLAPDLPRETSGAYLGELGKDSAAYECNGKEFHRLVLLRYVESFEFTDQSVVDCMRIFLSAFRLPGEAQQIDRILVAFSEHCYSQCVEGKLGILENAEVTYVLTFSIIMLNTDRHNPNVRADRKMTLEQFIRNNTFYGADSHQTVPLSKDLLVAIYASIDGCPIRTEGKEIAGAVTNEVWTDLQMQTRVYPKKAILVTTEENAAFLSDLLKAHSAPEAAESDRKELDRLLRENSPIEGAHGNSTAFIVRNLLDSQQKSTLVTDPVLLSMEISGLHGLFDADLLECVWLDLLRVCVCVHVHNALVMQLVVAHEVDRASSVEPPAQRSPAVLKPPLLRKLLSITNSFLVDLLRVTNSFRMSFVMDCAGLSLVLGAGMLKGTLAEKFLGFLRWESSVTGKSSVGKVDSLTFDGTIADSSLLLYQLRHFESARSSASTFLNLVQNNQAFVASWSVVWYFFGALRDCGVLPREMVVDVDADLLPPNVREEFEEVLLDMDRRAFEQRKPAVPKRVRRQSSSILSLQGLGEALFGGGAADDEDDDSPGESSAETEVHHTEMVEFKHLFRLDAVSARWDAGYEVSALALAGQSDGGAGAGKGGRSTSPVPASSSPSPLPPLGRHRTSKDQLDAGVRKTIPPFSIVDGGMTVEDLRSLVASSGAPQLVSDSRFLSEAALEALLKSLVLAAEAKDEFLRTDAFPLSPSVKVGSSFKTNSTEVEENMGEQQVVSSTEQLLQRTKSTILDCQGALNSRHSFSSSTVAWLEMVLVEVSLRNRDRFHTFWPILRHHYIRVLSGPHVSLCYVTERRVLGVLKICTRMISRDNFSGTILELLGRIFAKHGPSAGHLFAGVGGGSAGGAATLQSLSRDEASAAEDGYTLKPPYSPMASHVLSQLTNQISAAMWRVLTLNVEVLPLLPLEQWQILFSIISIAASAGGFSAIKSFESMAWLLHEPRLVAKVPVFCIIGVKPLLRNQQAPLSVSIGAVHLLTHLHGRLEVLIKDESEDYVDCEYDENSADGDTPLLWESCWTPILRALMEGIADSRTAVREACAEALCQAILDRHSQAVPAGVLVDILGGIISPMIVQLRDHLVEEINRGLPPSIPRILSSKEAAAVSQQQQWVTVDAADPAAGAPAATADGLPTLLHSHDWGTSSSGTVSSLMECLSALCKAFLQHLKKLSSYPSFDKLWLCILNVLGNFLDSQLHGSEELASISREWDQLSEDTRRVAQDLFAMLNSSRDHLLRMTRSLAEEKVFTFRPGLLSVTKDTVRHFEGCTEIVAELNLVL